MTGWRTACCHNSECVEVASVVSSVLVRDRDGTVLAFTSDAWRKFTASIS